MTLFPDVGILGNEVGQSLQGRVSLEEGVANGVDGTHKAALHHLQGQGYVYILTLGCFRFANGEVFRYCIVEFFLFRGKLVGNGFGVTLFVERTTLPVFHIFL